MLIFIIFNYLFLHFLFLYFYIVRLINSHHQKLQDGWCGGSAIGKAEMDSLFWKCYFYHLSCGAVRIWSNSFWIRQRGNYYHSQLFGQTRLMISEPNGRVEGIVQNDHHISLVPTQLRHPLPEQEGPAWGEDYVLAPSGLFSWVWW